MTSEDTCLHPCIACFVPTFSLCLLINPLVNSSLNSQFFSLPLMRAVPVWGYYNCMEQTILYLQGYLATCPDMVRRHVNTVLSISCFHPIGLKGYVFVLHIFLCFFYAFVSASFVYVYRIFLFQDASNIETTIICIPAVVGIRSYGPRFFRFVGIQNQ